jgi:hypothetical protein
MLGGHDKFEMLDEPWGGKGFFWRSTYFARLLGKRLHSDQAIQAIDVNDHRSDCKLAEKAWIRCNMRTHRRFGGRSL